MALNNEELQAIFNAAAGEWWDAGVQAVARAVAADCARTVDAVEYIRDWDGYTADDAAYATRSDASTAILAAYGVSE